MRLLSLLTINLEGGWGKEFFPSTSLGDPIPEEKDPSSSGKREKFSVRKRREVPKKKRKLHSP